MTMSVAEDDAARQVLDELFLHGSMPEEQPGARVEIDAWLAGKAVPRPMSHDLLVDVRGCALEVLRCYFHPDPVVRARWWREDYGGEPDAEEALCLIRRHLLG
jgi:hypothetical protein